MPEEGPGIRSIGPRAAGGRHSEGGLHRWTLLLAERAEQAAHTYALCGETTHATDADRPARAALLREVVGNPFRPATLPPETGTACREAEACAEPTALAEAAYEQRLPDGTLDNAPLTHLRSPGPHVRGCRALDLILAKS